MQRLLFFYLFFPSIGAAGQLPDSLSRDFGEAKDSLASIYYTAQKENSPLYNGRQFYSYSSSILGHAFYRSGEWEKGSVLYDGLWYHDIPMLYDVYRDELVISHPNLIPVILFSERVSQFVIKGEEFVYLRENENEIAGKGFYQVLKHGKAVVYKKSFKLLDEKIEGQQIQREFFLKEQFFVRMNNVYYRIKRQQDLLNVFKDKNREVNQYKNQLKLKYKGNAEKFIVSVAQYYNQL